VGKVCPIFLAAAMHPAQKPLTGRADGPTVAPVLSLLTDLRDFVVRHRAHG
jgi:hypothetical protein